MTAHDVELACTKTQYTQEALDAFAEVVGKSSGPDVFHMRITGPSQRKYPIKLEAQLCPEGATN